MTRTKLFLIISAACMFLAATTLVAERHEKTDSSRKLDVETARAMWNTANVGVGNLTFPQANGIVSAVQNSRTTGAEVTFSSATLPRGSCAVAFIVAPNGDSITTDTYCAPSSEPGAIRLELWSGDFPNTWPSGLTRFRVIVLSGNLISEANAYVMVRSCCANQGPVVTSVTALPNGTLQVAGQFMSPMVGVNGYFAQAIGGSTSVTPGSPPQSTITINNPVSLENGNGVVTVCEQGACSQTFFHVPAQYSGGGKG